MLRPLSDNPDHVRKLCSRLNIGLPSNGLTRIYGGFHHWMWRLETDTGIYAVKQLAPDADLNDPDVVGHYNTAEEIAEFFSERGIDAIFALKGEKHYLQIIGDSGYLVYPWTDAVALDYRQISGEHALKVAGLLAKIHRAEVTAPEPKEVQFYIQPEQNMVELVRLAKSHNTRYSATLEELLPDFLSIVETQRRAVEVLNRKLVISHGDLDHKNVLWDNADNPVVIDWESARKLNPTYEVVLECLDWGGITSQFSHNLFEEMLSAYLEAGGTIDGESLEPAFCCVLGDWLNWLLYNVGRAIDVEDTEQRELGNEQIDLALATLIRLRRLQPKLLAEARQCLEVSGN